MIRQGLLVVLLLCCSLSTVKSREFTFPPFPSIPADSDSVQGAPSSLSPVMVSSDLPVTPPGLAPSPDLEDVTSSSPSWISPSLSSKDETSLPPTSSSQVLSLPPNLATSPLTSPALPSSSPESPLLAAPPTLSSSPYASPTLSPSTTPYSSPPSTLAFSIPPITSPPSLATPPPLSSSPYPSPHSSSPSTSPYSSPPSTLAFSIPPITSPPSLATPPPLSSSPYPSPHSSSPPTLSPSTSPYSSPPSTLAFSIPPITSPPSLATPPTLSSSPYPSPHSTLSPSTSPYSSPPTTLEFPIPPIASPPSLVMPPTLSAPDSSLNPPSPSPNLETSPNAPPPTLVTSPISISPVSPPLSSNSPFATPPISTLPPTLPTSPNSPTISPPFATSYTSPAAPPLSSSSPPTLATPLPLSSPPSLATSPTSSPMIQSQFPAAPPLTLLNPPSLAISPSPPPSLATSPTIQSQSPAAPPLTLLNPPSLAISPSPPPSLATSPVSSPTIQSQPAAAPLLTLLNPPSLAISPYLSPPSLSTLPPPDLATPPTLASPVEPVIPSDCDDSSPEASAFFCPKLFPPSEAPAPLTPSTLAGPKFKGYDQDVYNVDDFGAVGNGIVNDTQAFYDTWKAACRQKKKRPLLSTTMIVPFGKVYLVYPITLRGPCQGKFTLKVSGKIVAPANPRQWKDYDNQLWILIKKVSNFTLTGPGAIDGQGFNWWRQSCKRNPYEPCRRAPTALTFRHSSYIDVNRMTLSNSQQMHLDLSSCSNVSLRYLNVFSPELSPNTDGIHIERSNSVFISQSTIATGDDCVSVGPGSSQIYIQDSACGPGHGISIGSLGKKRSFDRVWDVHVENVVLRNTMNGLRIKTWEGGRGAAYDFTFRDITMNQVKNPIVIDQFYCDSEHSGTCRPKLASAEAKGVSISSVSYSGIRGTSATQVAVMFRCSRGNPCHKISLDDVRLQYRNNQASSLCENAYGSAAAFVLPPTCLLSESKSKQHLKHHLRRTIHWQPSWSLYRMLIEGYRPSKSFLLRALTRDCDTLSQGKFIHTLLCESCGDTNCIVGSALMIMYRRFSCIDAVEECGERIRNGDVLTWTLLISANAQYGYLQRSFQAFERMLLEGIKPNKVTFLEALKACSCSPEGVLVESLVYESGLFSNVMLVSALVDAFGKCHNLVQAQRVFDGTTNVVCWNALIGAYARSGDDIGAFTVFRSLHLHGVLPDRVTFINVAQVVRHTLESDIVTVCRRETGVPLDGILGNAFILMHGRTGNVREAREVFDTLETKTIVSWNAIMTSCLMNEAFSDTLHLFNQMLDDRLEPDTLAVVSALGACMDFESARLVHARAAEAGLELSLPVSSSLMCIYSKCGKLKEVTDIFTSVPEPDAVTVTVMMQAYIDNSQAVRALELFSQQKFAPDVISYVTALNACAVAGRLTDGKNVLYKAVESGVSPAGSAIANAVLDLYVKCASLSEAVEVFKQMEYRDRVTWNTIVSAYARAGRVRGCVRLFTEMQLEGLQPSHVTFVSVLSAYSSAGLVEEGCRCFASVHADYGMVWTIEQYGCVVDLVGRAGWLSAAEELVRVSGVGWSPVLWKSVLSACRIHRDVRRARDAAGHVVQCDPCSDTAHVVLSNVHATVELS